MQVRAGRSEAMSRAGLGQPRRASSESALNHLFAERNQVTRRACSIIVLWRLGWTWLMHPALCPPACLPRRLSTTWQTLNNWQPSNPFRCPLHWLTPVGHQEGADRLAISRLLLLPLPQHSDVSRQQKISGFGLWTQLWRINPTAFYCAVLYINSISWNGCAQLLNHTFARFLMSFCVDRSMIFSPITRNIKRE